MRKSRRISGKIQAVELGILKRELLLFILFISGLSFYEPYFYFKKQ